MPIITHQKVTELQELIEDVRKFIYIKGKPYLDTYRRDGITLDVTYSGCDLYYNGCRILDLHRTYLNISQYSAQYYSNAQYAKVFANDVLSITCHDGENHETYTMQKYNPEEWDSQAFQYSTLYEENLCDLIMLIPHVLDTIGIDSDEVRYTLHLYLHNSALSERPYDVMSKLVKRLYYGA